MALTDELLRLSGSTNEPRQTITADANGTAVYVGANRLVRGELRIGGAVSGTNPTLDVKYQSSADNSSFSDIGIAHPQKTATMASTTSGVTPDVVYFRVPDGRPYVRAVFDVGGTSPSFGAVSVTLLPPSGGINAG